MSIFDVEQYNSIVRHFYEDVIEHARSQELIISITKGENTMQNLISPSACKALTLWEDSNILREVKVVVDVQKEDLLLWNNFKRMLE